MRELCDLDAIRPDELSLVGGKALGLGRMIRSELPVPCGFCVTTAAFEAYQGSGLPDSLAAQIDASCKRLGDGKVAVRSSATSEDGAITSFAGLQETCFGLEGGQAVRDAIVRCWNSLFSNRVAAYRHLHDVSEICQAMAVVVQRMIPAEVAGVIFTCDPRNPDATDMLVEASWGLGESVVSGRVTPDRWSLDKATGKVCHRQIATKMLELTLEGIKSVSPERQQQPCLDETQLRDLVELARRVEMLFGTDCDIEWAWSEGRFWLLQARPITTIDGLNRERVLAEEIATLKAKAAPDGTVWSRFHFAEVLPTPTPMTWSIIRKELLSGRGGFGHLYRDLGFDPDPTLDDDGVYDLAFGRPYCNLSREPLLYFRGFPLEHPFETLKADPRKALYPQPVLNPARLDWRFGCGYQSRFPC
ncbi:MAG: PEP/pyruvate-binding domain-containing protein [Planctomycetota bacterium]